MSTKSLHRDTQRSGRKKDPADIVSSDPLPNGHACSPPPPESPTPRDHERCRRELAEAKLLATNLEKNVRWWAECTSKWKERWARANAERHRAKKEARGLKQRVAELSQEVRELREELEGLRNHGALGEAGGEAGGTAEPAVETSLGALEIEVREVLKRLKNWRAAGKDVGEARGTEELAVETTLEMLETEEHPERGRCATDGQ